MINLNFRDYEAIRVTNRDQLFLVARIVLLRLSSFSENPRRAKSAFIFGGLIVSVSLGQEIVKTGIITVLIISGTNLINIITIIFISILVGSHIQDATAWTVRVQAATRGCGPVAAGQKSAFFENSFSGLQVVTYHKNKMDRP
jgi:hypothetical protein